MKTVTRDTTDPRHELYPGGPDVRHLKTQFNRALSYRDAGYWTRQRVNYEARYNLRDGKTWDGRKWKSARNKHPFPWPGASDIDVPMVDKYVREDHAMLMQVWANQRVVVRPTRPGTDSGWANKVTSFLRWMFYEEIDESEDEADLLGNIYLERGTAALGIWWERAEQLQRETITLDQIDNAARQAAARLQQGEQGEALMLQAELPAIIRDPSRQAEALQLIGGALGESLNLDPARIKRLLRDLRTEGAAHFPRSVVVRDRPVFRALALNDDLLLPPEATKIDKTRVGFIRERLSETDLQDRVRTMNWDANWVDQVIEKTRGVVQSDFMVRRRRGMTGGNWGLGRENEREIFEVITAYERLYDDDGIPGIYVTPFHPALADDQAAANHALLDYAHGRMPFVIFALERRSRLLDDARGYGERLFAIQGHVKRQWDSRNDRTDLATLPPMAHPVDEPPEVWGPGVRLPTDMPDRYKYFDAPRYDGGSKEFEDTVLRFADEYMGRTRGEENVVESQGIKRELVRGWMRGWKAAASMTLQLCQQYSPDEMFYSVVGGEQSRPIRTTRAEIQGEFHLSLRFNVGDMDSEFIQAKLGLIEKALQMDVDGRIDRGEALSAVFELIDPSYAERLIRPGEPATLAQIDDEQNILLKLLAGIPVDIRGNEAFALRKEVLMKTIQASPTIQQVLMRNPVARDQVTRRVKQLDFQIEQRMVNPQVGRLLGTRPAGMDAPAGQGAAAPGPMPGPSGA